MEQVFHNNYYLYNKLIFPNSPIETHKHRNYVEQMSFIA